MSRISSLWKIRMPKYYEFKVCGYYLYYTASCVIEAMHVHASDRKLTEAGSAKFFVMNNGDTTVERQGQLSDREVRKIREFIKKCILNGRKLQILGTTENKSEKPLAVRR